MNYTLGILYEDNANCGLTHDYFSGIMDAFKVTIEQLGHTLVFLNTQKNCPSRLTYLESVERYQLDGVMILNVNHYDSEQMLALRETNLPKIFVDHEFPDSPSVSSDNYQGIRNLTNYLISMGHKRIAFILGDNNSVSSLRLKSFLSTCEEHGITIPTTYIRQSEYRNMRQAAYYTEEFLRLPEPPTCIMFQDDFAAIGGINILHARGLSIPKDISVAGYDGLKLLSHYEPKLTTINQNTSEIGKLAAKMLIDYINKPSTTSFEHVIVPTSLEEGHTVGRAFY